MMRDSEANLLAGLPGDARLFENLLTLLRCPATGEPFRWEPIEQSGAPGGIWGLLHDGKGRAWPVLDSIPILLDGPVGAFTHHDGALAVAGPRPESLVPLLRAGRGREALVECLAIPYLPGANPRDEARARARGRLTRRAIGLMRRALSPAAGRAIRRRQLARLLARPADSVTTVELARIFYGPGSPIGYGYLPYFLYRFCLPRMLAAMALLELLPPSTRPVLDLACGMGHLGPFLRGEGLAGQVIGADFNFIPLWIARRTFARETAFVLLDASRPLPFARAAFGAAVCSDAFVYIPNKAGLVPELFRVAEGGALAFPRLCNRTVLPASGGEELSAAEWRDFFGRPELTWITSEERLLRDYLSGRGPDMRREFPPEDLAHDKYLSAFIRREGMTIPAPRRFDHPPHARGRLGLNPIYEATPAPDGGLRLRAWFDNSHFCLENAGATAYLPLRVEIDAATLAALRAGRRTPEIEALIGRFVLIGLPEHYAPDPIGIVTPGTEARAA